MQRAQILETVVGLSVIAWAVRDCQPLPDDLFRISWRRAPARCAARCARWGTG
jgi:hypothetical protein